MSKVKPLNGRLLVRPDPRQDEQEQTKGGIIVTRKAEERPFIGTVVVGSDDIPAGQKIIFSRYGYDVCILDNESLYLVSQATVLATITK